ncbi:MAG: cell division protein ZapA [Peptoniphilaceae bacterium]|nr:cell division protein ZapA [Peptoniphilaceae bacterium]MDY6085945.1 cell division protein ZapA [Peptoniphilaceae bacterium]
MAERNRLDVTIFGNDYVLHSSRPDAQMRRVVAYAQQKIDEAGSEQTRYNKTMQVTLACINLADEADEWRSKAQVNADALAALQGQVERQQAELTELQAELELALAAAEEKEQDLEAVHRKLEVTENKRLETAKQFQEYRRTHH